MQQKNSMEKRVRPFGRTLLAFLLVFSTLFALTVPSQASTVNDTGVESVESTELEKTAETYDDLPVY